jgi:hypothetical protein
LLPRIARHAIVRTNESASTGGSHVRLRHALEEYVRAHPHASDTLAGICDWWIPPALCPAPRDVEAALDELVADGILQRTLLIDSSELYSVRRDTVGERDEH